MHCISDMVFRLWCEWQSPELLGHGYRFDFFQEQASPLRSNVVVEVSAILRLSLESATVRQLVLDEAIDHGTDRHSVKLRLKILVVNLDAKVLTALSASARVGCFSIVPISTDFGVPFSILRNCQTSGPFFRFRSIKFPYWYRACMSPPFRMKFACGTAGDPIVAAN